MGRAASPRRSPFQPTLETLEDRLVPAQYLGFGNSVAPPPQWATDHILVRFQPDSLPQPIRGTQVGEELPMVDGLYRIELVGKNSVQQVLSAYRNMANVIYAQPDYVVKPAAVGNDTSFNAEWEMNNTGQTGGKYDVDIDATEGWDITKGNGSSIVAVIDTGVDWNHPDLAANIWTNTHEIAGNGIDDDGNGYIDDIHGWDFVNNDNNPYDDFGHGTHVAGILGAVGNNARGVTGIMWDVQIMPLKFIGANGSGSISDAIRALDYAVMMGAKVSNNSWGQATYDPAMVDAIERAKISGHIFVAAAGNNHQNIDQLPVYPASHNVDNMVAVASVDKNGNLSATSNWGVNTVDLAAPGDSIYSTLPNNRYGYLSGTSMAAPLVSGAAALVWEQHPDWTYLQVVDRLKQTVDHRAVLQGKISSGGWLNLARALRPDQPGAPGPVVDTITTFNNTAVSKVRVTFLDSLDLVQPTTFTKDDVKIYKPSNSPITVIGVTAVAGTKYKQFDITFYTQTMPGTFRVEIGPNILDNAGNTMNQDRDSVSGEAADDRYLGTFRITRLYTFSSTTVTPITDLQSTTSTINIGQNLNIVDLNVKLNISHTYDSDLVIHLIAPDGTDIVLVNRRGGAGDNFTGTIFNDESGLAIGSGAASFMGSYKPESLLSVLDGKNASGPWQLRIDDLATGNVGKLNSWSLTIEA